MENKALNIVVIHKQSGWSKFKRRLSSWFSSDKAGDPLVVPEIIVTSHEDAPEEWQQTKGPEKEIKEETSGEVQFRSAGQEELAQAHQNVIAEMRNSLAEARGAANRKRNSVAGTGPAEKTGKPPVPPTKAAAVAKIRETIAQAKRESDKELSLTENIPSNNVSVKENKHKSDPESERLRIENNCSERGDPADTATDEDKEARRAAIRAKLREAILGAAASGNLTQAPRLNNPPRPVNIQSRPVNNQPKLVSNQPRPVNSQPRPVNNQPRHVNNQIARNDSERGQVRRKSSGGGQQEKPRETIWQFFEEGNKKGTCRTCGYVVGIKNNKGGLTRHLSLVHQKEYKLYTAQMEQNWTNGMLEKNLNMRVPTNF